MFDFVEDYFTIENTFDYILSIQVSLNGFSFCITQANENTVVAFKTTSLKISSKTLLARRFKEWYFAETILQKHFQKTRLIVFGNKYTLVPSALHHNQFNDDIIYLLFKDSEKYQMAENVLETIDGRLLFALPDDFQKTLSETIGECEIVHPIKLLANRIKKSTHAHQVQLLYSNKDLYVLIAKNNELLFSNNFTVNHSNDAVYYVLSALKQLEINAKEMQLLHGGKSIFIADSIKTLSKHFKATQGLKPANNTIIQKINTTQVSENITLFL